MRVLETLKRRGFLPAQDPASHFPSDSPLSMLDVLGRDLPSLLEDRGFREFAQQLKIPSWPREWSPETHRPLLQLYYVRLGFLASGYVNQTSEGRATLLPHNIAAPLVQACKLLDRPPILSYDGYCLYNWRRFNTAEAIKLGNVDTIQNFVHLYDEHWFILVHVEIEAIGAEICASIAEAETALEQRDDESLTRLLKRIAEAVWRQAQVLRRIPEKMDAGIYYRKFRPYIRYFEDVVYKGIDIHPMNQRGETGAQSSIMPALVAFMKIPHEATSLTNHLLDMRCYMPKEHRDFIGYVESLPTVKDRADKGAFNDVLEAMATFREVHYHWSQEYINRQCKDQLGTGGTPYAKWLKQLIEETRAHRID